MRNTTEPPSHRVTQRIFLYSPSALCASVPLWFSVFLFAVTCTAGPPASHVVQLPNGWKIAPAGKHLPLGDLPLEMLESNDGKYLIVTNNGYSPPVLSVVDLQHLYTLDRVSVSNAWLGLAQSPDGKTIYSSAGGDCAVDVFRFINGALTKEKRYPIGKKDKDAFTAGISISKDGQSIFALQVFDNTLEKIAASGQKQAQLKLDAEPYASTLHPSGQSLFVSIWGGSKVIEVSTADLKIQRVFDVGEHPNAMVFSPDAKNLYVACANTNNVYVIDLQQGKAVAQISVALYPQAPVGSTPTGLGISPDGKTLLVANSDNNAVAVVDLAANRTRGFIPSGWYPTAAHFTRDGKRILILSGKGLTSTPNPRGPDEPFYIAQLLHGTLSVVDVPDDQQLAAYTKTVYSLTPYSDDTRLKPAAAPSESPVPRKVGDSSPIKHVFYVIRENRTYDQVLGDIEKANGDPNLCLFGEEVTPNAHAIVNEFVLMDNFYVDAEVSADGHSFSMGAYAPDTVEKTWPMDYAERGAKYLPGTPLPQRNAYGNLGAPPQGYIWDAAQKAGISIRVYGEFGYRGENEEEDSGIGDVQPGATGLKGIIHPQYPAWDLKIPDNKRVDIWLEEFRKYEKEGTLPRLSILQLGGDHTSATDPGYPTPRAMVAENDVALGRVVDAISHSRYWKESAIFVLEDDAQDGPDHVDAHRSVALVISPYARRNVVDSTMYTTSGILRTIELILGLPPMSQYDAAATPLYNAFQMTATADPFVARKAKIPLDEMNDEHSFGAAASKGMNFKDADRAPMGEMNEILWKSIKGADSIMPPPVHSAFVRPLNND